MWFSLKLFKQFIQRQKRWCHWQYMVFMIKNCCRTCSGKCTVTVMHGDRRDGVMDSIWCLWLRTVVRRVVVSKNDGICIRVFFLIFKKNQFILKNLLCKWSILSHFRSRGRFLSKKFWILVWKYIGIGHTSFFRGFCLRKNRKIQVTGNNAQPLI